MCEQVAWTAVRDGGRTGTRPLCTIVVLGDWAAAHVGALASLFTVADAATAAYPVDWLVATAGSTTPATVHDLACELRAASSPELRVAVVDLELRWPAGESCDVHIAGDVEPGELSAILWLTDRGFTVSRHTASRGRHWESPIALTKRENEMLQALCAGLGNDQMARKFQITRSTVEFHLTKIFKKLAVSSRTEAIVRAMQHNPRLSLSGV